MGKFSAETMNFYADLSEKLKSFRPFRQMDRKIQSLMRKVENSRNFIEEEKDKDGIDMDEENNELRERKF